MATKTYTPQSPEYLSLEGFFFNAWISKWKEGSPLDCQFWAQELDKLGISWSLQNRLAGRAYDDRNSGFIYFRNVLSQEQAKL